MIAEMEKINQDGTKYVTQEFKYNPTQNSTQYYIITLGKSDSGHFVDGVVAVYNAEFEIAPGAEVTPQEHSLLYGFINWTTNDSSTMKTKIGEKTIQALENFFQMQALEEFKKEGVIDHISYAGEEGAVEV